MSIKTVHCHGELGSYCDGFLLRTRSLKTVYEYFWLRPLLAFAIVFWIHHTEWGEGLAQDPYTKKTTLPEVRPELNPRFISCKIRLCTICNINGSCVVGYCFELEVLWGACTHNRGRPLMSWPDANSRFWCVATHCSTELAHHACISFTDWAMH